MPSVRATARERQASLSIHDLNRLTRDSALILSLECTSEMLALLVVLEEEFSLTPAKSEFDISKGGGL